MEYRLSLIWMGLLSVIESTDILTTGLARAKGAIESMPVSAAVLNEGGMALFANVKVLLVSGFAAALLLALRWLRLDRMHARWFYQYVLAGIRLSTIALAIVSLNNAVLLRSLA